MKINRCLAATVLLVASALRAPAALPVVDLRELDSLHRPWLPGSLEQAEHWVHVEAYWKQLAEYNRLLENLRALSHEGGNP
jgi:hypothetical protein